MNDIVTQVEAEQKLEFALRPRSTIESRPDAPQGSVLHLDGYAPSDFAPADAILCRNTAPLIAFAFDLLRRNVACHVVGRDIQIGLEKLIDKIGGTDITNFRHRLEDHCGKEFNRLLRKGKRAQAESYADKCQALTVLAAQSSSTGDLKLKIQSLFANGDGVTLSTIHKAKSLEWETVWLLDFHLLPAKWAEQEWEKVQERNLQYVAVTRAKLNLKFINSGQWKSL